MKEAGVVGLSLCGVREEQRSGPKAQAQSGGGRAAYLFRPFEEAKEPPIVLL